jgi:hypothetical protein
MNVEIGTEAAQFPEKDYINRIFLAERNKLLADLLCSARNKAIASISSLVKISRENF